MARKNRCKNNLTRDFVQTSDSLKKIPKCPGTIESCRLSKFFLEIHTLNSSSDSQFKTQNMYWSVRLKYHWLCCVARKLDCPKVPENDNEIDLSRYSNSNVLPITALVSSLKVSIDSFTFAEDNLFEKLLYFETWSGFFIVSRRV